MSLSSMNQSVISLNALQFPLHGTRLIEASAGTGKTYTLAALYVRLVLAHGTNAVNSNVTEPTAFSRPLLPPDILVVTFTRAATAELRDRIRARLVEAAQAFRQQLEKPDAFLTALLADYAPQDHPACASALDLAAEWMDEAAVFTIHGWCQRMLSEHAFDSGAAFAETLQDDNQQLQLQLAADYWRLFLYPLQDASLLAELGKLSQSPQHLLQAVQPWLQADASLLCFNTGGQPLPAPLAPEQALAPMADWAAQMDTLCQQITTATAQTSAWLQPPTVLQLLDDAFADKYLNGNKFRASSWTNNERPWFAQLCLQPCLFNWRDSQCQALLKKYSQANLTQAANKGKPVLDHPLFMLFEELTQHLQNKPQPELAVRHHAALWLQSEFNRRKKQQAQLDYNDLLIRLQQALLADGGDVLAQRIRQQFPVAMVDEFQDTDPLQFSIFQAIYSLERVNSPEQINRPERENSFGQINSPEQKKAIEPETSAYALILVGDPKQAIYSFRGADLYTYLNARALTAGRHYSLDTNYRSTSELVQAVNQLFINAEQQLPAAAFGFATETANALPFLPVAAAGKSQQLLQHNAAVPALNYWLLDTPAAELKKGQYQAQMAAACADQITLMLRQAQRQQCGIGTDESSLKPLQPADIAVLVRDKNEAALVRQQLAARQIRSVYLSDQESVFATAEAAAVLHWLQACHAPEDEALLRSALVLPLSANSDGQLQHWLNNETAWEALTDQLRVFKQLWRQQGVLAMLQHWLHYFALPAKWLAQDNGERILTNVLHLAELLQSESQQREGESGLIRWLAEQLQDPAKQEEQQLRLESDQQLVQVITIHKAKGLQYPVVFLPFICSYRAPKKDKPLRYFADGQIQLDITPDDNTLALADHERLLEEIRLLYVALTRPIYACWLGLAAYSEGQSKSSCLHRSALGYLLNIGPDCSTALLQQALTALPWQQQPLPAPEGALTAPQSAVLQPALQLHRPLQQQRWWIASYSALRLGNMPLNDEQQYPDLALQGAFSGNMANEQRYISEPETAAQALMQEEAAEMPAYTTQFSDMHQFPRGAVPGTFLHMVLEWCARHGFANVDAHADPLQSLLIRWLEQRSWQPWLVPLQRWLEQMLQTPLQAAQHSLPELTSAKAELEFWLQTRQVNVQTLDKLISAAVLPGHKRPALLADTLNGMLKGFIDLTLQGADGKYWVLDYKSSWLGDDNSAYSETAMQQTMLEKRYDVQAVLYLFALHRLLKMRQPGYRQAPQHYLGGAIYWFIRAPEQGQFALTADITLMHQLDKLFAGKTVL